MYSESYKELSHKDIDILHNSRKNIRTVFIVFSLMLVLITFLFSIGNEDFILWSFCGITILLFVSIIFLSNNDIKITLEKNKKLVIIASLIEINIREKLGSGHGITYFLDYKFEKKSFTVEQKESDYINMELYHFANIGDEIELQLLIYTDTILYIKNITTGKDTYRL